MKLVSLLLAALLWFTIRADRQQAMTFRIPLQYQNLPEGTMITEDVPGNIRVRLRGSKMKMANMGEEFFAPYVVNLEEAKIGDNARRVYRSDFKVPFGVNIVEIKPEILQFNLGKALTKVVPVEPKIVGFPAKGYRLKSVDVSPSEVQIRSHLSQLDSIQKLYTEEINLEGRRRSFDGRYKLNTLDFDIMTFNEKVGISFEIEKIPEPAVESQLGESKK